MRSCSRAVVQSCRMLSLLLIGLILPWGTARANEETPQGLVQIDVSEPGVFVIDGSNHKTILPIIDYVRSFPSMEAYREFIRSAFNSLDTDEPEGLSITIVTIGQLYAYSPDLQQIIPVSDPVATLIGGRYGRVAVDGVEYCIDGDRCSEPVRPFSLTPSEFEVSQIFWPSAPAITSPAASSSFPVAPNVSGQGVAAPFQIQGMLGYKRDPFKRFRNEDGSFSFFVDVEIFASNRQVSGGFQTSPMGWVPRTWSDCSVFEGTQLSDCYLVPETPIPLWTSGENHLSVTLGDFIATQKTYHYCETVDFWHRERRQRANVVDIVSRSVRTYIVPLTYYTSYLKPQVYPEKISGYFAGWDEPNPPHGRTPTQEGPMMMITGIPSECDH